MRKVFCLLVALGLPVLNSPFAAAVEMAKPSEIRCDIRKTVEGSIVRLEAFAMAGPAASGSYSFSIRKSGASGVAQNRQGGSFSVSAGESRVISTSMINAGPDDRYDAELTLEWNGSTLSCTIEG